MSRCVLNVSTNEHFQRGQARLAASLATVGENAQQLLWQDWPVPSRTHAVCNYGFKIDTFDVALKHGFDQALWLDAPIWAERPLDPIWGIIEREDVLLLRDGWDCGQWTSDAALPLLGWKSRDEAFQAPQTLAGVLGVNLASERGRAFLDRWRGARDAGAFNGPHSNAHGEASSDRRCLGHRHDQTAASAIGWQMGIPFQELAPIIGYRTMAGEPVFRLTDIPLSPA